MSAIWTIAKKEYQLAMRSVATYIVFTLFLVVTGVMFSSMMFRIALAELRPLFEILQIVFVFYVPAITMGSIAKERQSGTLELLCTMPLKHADIVWGKIVAGIMLLKTMLATTLVFLVIIMIFGEGIDYGAIICGYLGLMLAGSAYVAIGVFASSLPSNQILAFVLALLLCSVLYLLKYVVLIMPLGLVEAVQYLSFEYHLSSFMKGVIDIRDILFFLAVMAIFAFLAEFNLQARNLVQEK